MDYSVHFLARYRALRQQGLDAARAVSETMVTSGRAIVFNSLAVAGGFFVLLLSSFWPVIHMGWLVAANMIFSAILAILLLPAVVGSWTWEALPTAGARRISPGQHRPVPL